MENLPQKTHKKTHSKNLDTAQKALQITEMIKQCFAIQNTYGKTPEDLEILMIAMVEDLKKYPLSAIQNAFRKWRQTKSQVPTPAEIIKLVETQTAEGRKGIKKFRDFQGTWPEYKAYLDEHGLLNPSLKAF